MTTIKGLFKRIAPASFAEKVGIPLGWVVISHHHIPEKSDRRTAHARWYHISSGGFSIYRNLRFSPRLHYGTQSESDIVLDWVGWLDLHGRADDVDGPLELELTPVPTVLIPLMIVRHPDPTFRMMGWLALLSVALGILSIILAFK